MKEYSIKDDVEKIIEGKQEKTVLQKVMYFINTHLWIQLVIIELISLFFVFFALILALNIFHINSNVIKHSAGHLNAVMIVAVFVTLLIVFFIWAFMTKTVLKPLYEIGRNIKEIEKGNLYRTINIEGDNEIWRFVDSYNKMAAELAKEKMEAAYQYEERMKAVKMQNSAERLTIESQVNIDFLSQTVSFIETNYKNITVSQINEIMGRLLEILLYVNPHSDLEATVGSEIEFMENYLYIQKMIKNNSFDYEFDISPIYYSWPATKLFLLPFVDNCLTHGFKGYEEGGQIKIFASEYQNRLELNIWDNGLGLDDNSKKAIERTIKNMKNLDINLSEISAGMNIQNTISKLYYFYGERLDIKIRSAQDEGTDFLLYLPVPNKFSWQKFNEN